MSAKRQLGEPTARSEGMWGEPPVRVETLLYAEDDRLRHVRKLLHVDTHEECDRCVSQHMPEWVCAIEIASTLATGQTASPDFVPNSANYFVVVGEGDETAEAVALEIKSGRDQPADLLAAARLIEAWRPATRPHLHFLAGSMHTGYPLKTRWLDGYRFLEWHFRRGKVGLARDASWQGFLAEHGGQLDELCISDQSRAGLLEEVRASVAHALLAHRRDPNNDGATLDMAAKTFPILQALCAIIMTEISVDGIAFQPNATS
jgi:hypothetical protein